MLEKLNKVEERYEELARLMADPEVVQNYERVTEYAKERASLEEIVGAYRAYKRAAEELEETKTLLADDTDPEMQELAQAEIDRLGAKSPTWSHDSSGYCSPKTRVTLKT